MIKIYKKIVEFILSVFTHADKETIRDRRIICSECIYKQWNETFKLFSCGDYLSPDQKETTPLESRTCGCDIAQKTQLKNFECPQKKWPKA